MEKQFSVKACRWFDKYWGNTYHSVRCTRHSDGAEVAAELQYGYGECYRQTAIEIMQKAGWLASDYNDRTSHNILWEVSDGKKRDCKANGIL